LQFYERSQLFIGAHNQTLPVAPMGVSNKDRSPVGIDSGNAAPTPTALAEDMYGWPGIRVQLNWESERRGLKATGTLLRAVFLL
jgi:hypothetical protein